MASADRVATAATAPPDQLDRDYREFLKDFMTLEGGMESISQAIEANVSTIAAEAAS